MKNTNMTVELASIREAQLIRRAAMLRTNNGYIPLSSFRAKRNYFTNKVGILDSPVCSIGSERSTSMWTLYRSRKRRLDGS